MPSQHSAAKIFFTLASLSFGCAHRETPTPAISPEETRRAAIDEAYGEIVPYGEGVWKFPADFFPETLRKFKEDNPDLEVAAMTQGEDEVRRAGPHNYYVKNGFIVSTEPKPGSTKPGQEE
jgi:hypothetical protein